MPPRKGIGKILVDEGFIAGEQPQTALAAQQKTGAPPGSALFTPGFISQKNPFMVLSATRQNSQQAPRTPAGGEDACP